MRNSDYENTINEETGSAKNVEDADRLIGEKISQLRTTMGITRQQLAENIGVTHQQLHKYERGINRITAGRLVALAQALNINVSAFFNAFEETLPEHYVEQQRSCVDLTRDFLSIENPDQREAIRALVRAIAEGSKV